MRVDLEIGVLTDVDGVGAKLESVGDSALRMADDVSAASSKADAATSRMDSVAESADGMASSSSQAAGGIGDLGGALALMPGPLGAVGAGMEAAAPAIMGVTGAADLLNLVTKATIVQKTREKIAMAASTVTTKVHTGVIKAQTLAQRALNLAMRASPLMWVVTGVLLIAGAFTFAYKRSETFRRIVDAVLDKVGSAVQWLGDKVRQLPEVWEAMRNKVSAVLDRVKGLVDGLRDKITGAGAAVRDKLGGAFDWVMDKVQPIIDAVQWIIDKIASIKLPDLNPFGRTTVNSGRGVESGGVTYVDERNFSVTLTVDAAANLTDPSLVKQLLKLLQDQQTRAGTTPTVWVPA